MKLGTENKTQVYVLGILLVLAVLLLARAFWPSEPSPAAAPSTSASGSSGARPAMRRTASGRMVAAEPRLDPTLNFDLLRQSEEIKYAGNGRNIFVAGSVPIEKPKGTGATDHPVAPVYTPPAVAPPPPINLKFFGFASKPGEAKKVFLLQNEDMFIAGEGDIVDRRYRVLRITNSPPAVEVEDVLNNHKQSLPLVQG